MSVIVLTFKVGYKGIACQRNVQLLAKMTAVT